MKKQLQELLEITKNGNKEDMLAYLPNLEIEYNADHTNGEDRYYVVSVYDDLESYLDGKDNWDWEDLQEDLIVLLETYLSIDYEENGLVITDYNSMADGYLPWHNSEIKSEKFLKQ